MTDISNMIPFNPKGANKSLNPKKDNTTKFNPYLDLSLLE